MRMESGTIASKRWTARRPLSPGWIVKSGLWFATTELMPMFTSSTPARPTTKLSICEMALSPACHVCCLRARQRSISDQASLA